MSLVSLPSLGVSSLDLGRTDLRAAPFIFQKQVLGGRPARLMAEAKLANAAWHKRGCVLRRNITGPPADRHSAAARPSSNSGSAANTLVAMSRSAPANFWKSLLFESDVSSR